VVYLNEMPVKGGEGDNGGDAHVYDYVKAPLPPIPSESADIELNPCSAYGAPIISKPATDSV
jgi:hypothetical protein